MSSSTYIVVTGRRKLSERNIRMLAVIGTLDHVEVTRDDTAMCLLTGRMKDDDLQPTLEVIKALPFVKAAVPGGWNQMSSQSVGLGMVSLVLDLRPVHAPDEDGAAFALRLASWVRLNRLAYEAMDADRGR